MKNRFNNFSLVSFLKIECGIFGLDELNEDNGMFDLVRPNQLSNDIQSRIRTDLV